MVHWRNVKATADRLDRILADHRNFRRHIVPLCAAETPISPYVRAFLSDSIHETYAMGGPITPAADNFAAAGFVLDLHRLTIELCKSAFGVTYADPRPLSGTNAVTTLLMTMSEPGQRILLQTSGSGGHASMLPICQRLGLRVVDLPYDVERLQLDVDALAAIDPDEIDLVLIAPSDLLYPPALEALRLRDSAIVIYDATQTLGLIASGHAPDPFAHHPRTVVSGGTHKTLPGPSSGLLLTRDEELARTIDSQLSPKFVRHSHPHHIAALCAALIEQQVVGDQYSRRILEFSGCLSHFLEAEGLDVVDDDGRVTETHQIFLHVPEAEVDAAVDRAYEAGITLNAKRKPLFKGTGLRIGIQEIARYKWTEDALASLAVVLAHVVRGTASSADLRSQIWDLATLNTFDESVSLPRRPDADLVEHVEHLIERL